MSNSRFFDLQLGWRSLCVEANPQVYKRLTVNRPDCINVNTLVGRSSDFNGSSSVPYISFYRPPGKEKLNTDRDWETGLSGVESTYATNNEITSLRRAQSFAKLKFDCVKVLVRWEVQHIIRPSLGLDDMACCSFWGSTRGHEGISGFASPACHFFCR